MDFILMDIKNFLKKLENGQLEIEAGQWELHRDITNMRKMVNELKNLKEELGKMRMSSQQQMGLIRKLQDKFDFFRNFDSEDVSVKDSVIECDNRLKNLPDQEEAAEDFDQKCLLLPSDDILEIASHTSKVKNSDLGMLDPQGIDDEDVEFTMEGLENSYSDTSEKGHISKQRKSSMKPSEERLSSPHYITSSTNQDILHRYLQDSAKYLGQKTSGSIEITFEPSITSFDEQECSTNEEDSPSFEGDDCSSMLRADSDAEYCDPKPKMSALWRRKQSKMGRGHSKPSKSTRRDLEEPSKYKDFDRSQGKRQMTDRLVYCRTCGEGFSNRSRLKKHTITHWMGASANGKGFKCSYCKKICPTPETLTQHLRKCRIITRSYNRMK